jgi:hypothetical protein
MALLLSFSLSGCAAVYVKSLPGEGPLVLTASEWEGEWIGGDEVIVSIKVIDSQRGVLQLAGVDYDPNNQPRLAVETVHLRKWGNFLFACAPTQLDGNIPAYFWARVERIGDRIIFWVPKHQKIKDLVEAGKLPGTIEKDGDVVLGDLKGHDYEILTSEKEGVLYQWDNPGVLVRLIPYKVK